MKDYAFYKRALKLDKKNAGTYYAERAVLYFRDLNYECAWQDFQKAQKLGVDLSAYCYYDILKFSDECREEDLVTNIEKKVSFHQFYNTIEYYIQKQKFKEAYNLIGQLISKHLSDMLIIRKAEKLLFDIRRAEYLATIAERPKYEAKYYSIINLYVLRSELFSQSEKKFYRQRINKYFDKLEKISKHPACVCLARAKYFEQLNEIRYAIKFCQKAADIAKSKNDKGLVYIASSILKDLYVKNYNIDKALDIATELVKTKPVPDVLAKAVNAFYYIPELFSYVLPPEFQKLKSYKLIIKNYAPKERAKKRAMNKRLNEIRKQKGFKNGKNYCGKENR